MVVDTVAEKQVVERRLPYTTEPDRSRLRADKNLAGGGGVRTGRTRRRRRTARTAIANFSWLAMFIVLVNVGALTVFEPVRDPLKFENYLSDDSVTHFAVFFVCVLIGGPLILRWFSLGVTAIGLLFFGIAAEIVQAFSFGRTADFVDLVADEAGILAALLVISAIRGVRRLSVADDRP